MTKLVLDWRERAQFLLGDDGTVKRVKFADTLCEQNNDTDCGDFAASFDADFMLMISELVALIANR
ncbi:recombination-associated protein RdgC [Sodalis-like endosymbiont of Proechinophthirus fluctus]|uniref:recombination-associated protein RdgC n=1 Tax=Sodalis-like endosymbiont of Proechinophthirus fluctus TaxID=1462730 RepID=UPI001FCB7FC4|nr:recombination-associated protein RdgC [Sodalis-like endosymbiont of Proechinophthirus fluctus]